MTSLLLSSFNPNSIPDYATIQVATQTDLNNAPVQVRNVQFNVGTFDTNMAGLVATGTQIQNVPAGVYQVDASLVLVGDVRTNLTFVLLINGGIAAGVRGNSGYIRNTQDHNTSSVHINGIVRLNAISNIGLGGQREANAGLVTSINTLGNLSLERLE